MKTQNDIPGLAHARPEVDPLLVGRWNAFQSRLGRLRLKTFVRLRRITWHWIVDSPEWTKRAMDIAGASLALAILSPLLVVIALLVRLDGGTAFFAQTRVGLFGRKFKMYKFRSMRPDAEQLLKEMMAANQHQDGVTFKIKGDPRITPLGRWLRRFSVDELPQFYNVLIGDMSLVGPRPPVVREVALYSLADRRRLHVKPGLTCIWQISGRAEIDFSGQVRLDVTYIENQSLSQDLRILARTPRAILAGAGSY